MRTHFGPTAFSVCSLAAVLLFAGCGKSNAVQGTSSNPVPADSGMNRPPVTSSVEPAEHRRAIFLTKIRETDPNKATIEKAVINQKNELGLILSHQTNLDDVPELLKAMLTQMNHVFPDQDLTAVAYTPTNPPHTIGTAHLNIRTRDMSYEAGPSH